MVNGCRSKLANVVSGVPQGSVFGPLLFLLYTSEVFSILENKLIGYSDDSSLMAVEPSSGVWVAVAESLIRDLGRVSEWCDLYVKKLNACKTKTMIVSMSRKIHPQSPPLTIGGTVLKVSDDWPCYIGSDISFQDDLWETSSLGLKISFSKTWYLEEVLGVFHDRSLLGRCFRRFVLPVLEYCSAVWCSAADTHLKLLDRTVSGARFLTGGVFKRPWQSCILCFIRSSVTRCTLLMVLYLDCMCQCGLQAAL